MNGWIRDNLKSEWKWLLGLVVAGIIGWTTLKVTVKANVNDVGILKADVTLLKTFKEVQSEVNRTMEKKLDKIDDKLDRLLRR